MQPSSQNLSRGGIYSLQKTTRKFDFRSVCNKIPKTAAFTSILTPFLGISYLKSIFYLVIWNLIPQSRIHFYKMEFTFSIHQFIFFSNFYYKDELIKLLYIVS